MVEEFCENYDCWSWFDDCEDKIRNKLERKREIDGFKTNCKQYKNDKRKSPDPYNAVIPIETLKEISQLQPLGMFLYLTTETKPDFFVDQIGANDSMERVLIYSLILVTLCDLDLLGYHNDILRKVASCRPLLAHYEEIVRKLCTKSFRTMWEDLKRVDLWICYMRTLLMQAQRAGVMDKHGMETLSSIWKYLKDNGNPKIAGRPVCKQFLQELNELFSVGRKMLAAPKQTLEIYPTLDELQHWLREKPKSVSCSKLLKGHMNTARYINSQRLLIRQQFVEPLRQVVCMLHQKRRLCDLNPYQVAFENVHIKLNRNFEATHNSRMLFIDLVPRLRKSADGKRVKLDPVDLKAVVNLKGGAMLCLSTDYSFNNLILATAAPISMKEQTNGYIAINILRKFNIGNVFRKNLIMFETPVYFEPFQQAYRYLTNMNVINFPMADYIVHGITKTTPPAYLRELQPLNVYESQKFQNKVHKMPLNDSQVAVLERVVKTNFNLIQGPPGTGKSHLSMQLVKTMLEHAKLHAPILVVSVTNDSLDKFLAKLSVHTDSIVRFGRASRMPEISKFNASSHPDMDRINPRLKLLYSSANKQIKKQFERLQELYAAFNDTDKECAEIWDTQQLVWNAQEKLNSIRMIFQHYLVANKNVMAMTTTCAARMNFIFRFLKTRIVIFEEAADIPEAQVLPCLTPYTEHMIMIGDHMQMKPVACHFSGFTSSATMCQSLFERLILSNFPVNVLSTQYRMRQEFVDLLCPLMYPKLLSHESVHKYPAVRSMSMNLYFLDHREAEQRIHNVYITNEWEVQHVHSLVSHLVQVGGYTGKEIVVLAAYSMQVDAINRKLSRDKKLPDIGVQNISSFQGQDADIVVLSLARSNEKGNTGFLSQANRICVALSRARYGLYILGNMKTLAHNSTWSSIRKRLELQNAIGERFPCEINGDL